MRRRHVVLLVLALLACAAWWQGWFAGLDAQAVGRLVGDAGPWGPVLFLLLFALGNGLGAPGFLFVLPASALWPLWQAFLLNWLGAIGAGLVGYAFARSIGRQFVERHLSERLRGLDESLTRNALRTVTLVRLTLFLSTPSHWALGLTGVPLRPLLLGSLLGFGPPAALWTFGGRALLDAIQRGDSRAWAALLGVIVLAVALSYWLRRRSARLLQER